MKIRMKIVSRMVLAAAMLNFCVCVYVAPDLRTGWIVYGYVLGSFAALFGVLLTTG
jgi:hypothetical protein